MTKIVDEAGEENRRRIEEIAERNKQRTLQDNADIEVWTYFNLILQAVTEIWDEGEYDPRKLVRKEYMREGARPPTEQLTILSLECCRRGMFAWKADQAETSDDQLWTWYKVLYQLVMLHPREEGVQENYRAVIHQIKDVRGHKMPAQVVQLDPLTMDLRPTKAKAKAGNTDKSGGK